MLLFILSKKGMNSEITQIYHSLKVDLLNRIILKVMVADAKAEWFVLCFAFGIGFLRK